MGLPFRGFWLDTPVVSIDGKPIVDCVIRYEHLAADIESVCMRLGIPWKPELLGRYKSDYRINQQPYTAYYDEACKQRVMKMYDFDFKHFGYV